MNTKLDAIEFQGCDPGRLMQALRQLAGSADTLAEGEFPAEMLAHLQLHGLLRAPLPVEAGGLGWHSEASPDVSQALRLLGAASLSLGRVFEAHLNAIQLVQVYGGPASRRRMVAAVEAGDLVGLWVTSWSEPLRTQGRAGGLWLHGLRDVCSAAAQAGSAVVTLLDNNDQERMAFIAVHGVVGPALALHGMSGADTRAVRFNQPIDPGAIFGHPGDYTREPLFSTGAWRTCAVTVGGLERLATLAIGQLVRARRHRDAHQAERIGKLLIATRSARMWLERIAEAVARREPDRAATVGLARAAIEDACLQSIALVQRSLGLACMARSNPLEALMRDLATYLRQPSADGALTEAAISFAEAQPKP